MPQRHAKSSRTIIAATVLALLCLSLRSWGDTSPKQIKKLVERELVSQLDAQNIRQQRGQRVSYKISRVDPRLRLADCEVPVSVDLGTANLLGRVTAKVACKGASPWTIYVPLSVQVFKKVVTVRSPATTGKILKQSDLQLSEKEVSSLTQGYFSDFNQVANKLLKRSVTMNGVVTPNMIEEPKVIRKGDEVMIVAAKGTLSVSSPGIALSDGRVGQQISVKNSSSKRVVKAVVKQKGWVEVTI